MFKLFIANKNYSSWSLRPWVLMRELTIPFEEALVPFASGGEPSGFFQFSPTGRVPCLVDGDTTVWDSLAITEYLAESQAGVWPVERAARTWARCAVAEMHSGFASLRDTCSMSCGVRIRIRSWPAAVLRDWSRIDALWREGLSRFGGPYLSGAAFTAADAFFAPVAFRAQSYEPGLSAPSASYVASILALPSMQDWYRAALIEPWRDAAHEEESKRAGDVLQDLRR